MVQLLLLMIQSGSPDAVYLHHRITLDLTSQDSSYVETTSEVIVPLTSSGVSRYRSISSTYWNTWEDLEVEATISHWRSGRGEEVAVLREEPHSSLLPGNRLESSLRELHIDFPGIEIGDTLRISVRREISRLPLGDFYSYTFYAGSRDSIASGVLTVIAAPDARLLVSDPGYGFSASDHVASDGTRRMVWETGAMSPAASVPFSMDPSLSGPRITVSNHSPEELSRGLYRMLVADCLEGHPEPEASLLEETGGTPEEMCRWVYSEVDYLGGQWGPDPGYSPRAPGETLRDRAGVCREKALLLLWLLRGSGYDPFVVLTSYGSPPGPLPGSRSFDHMLLGIVRGEEDTVFLDPTNPLPEPGYTYALRGREYLPLLPEGSGVRRFRDSSEGDTLRISLAGVLRGDDATVTGDIDISFSGSAEELFRAMLSSVPESSRHELLARLFVSGAGSDLRLTGDPSDVIAPFSVHGSGSWPCRIISGHESTHLILPGLQDIDLVGSRAAALLLPDIRRDLMIETPYTAVLELRVTGIPHGSVLPEPVRREGYSIRVSLSGDTLKMMEELSIVPVYPDEYETDIMREACMEASVPAHRTVVLE